MGNSYLRHGSSIREGGARDNMGNYYSSQDSSMMLEFCIRGRGGVDNMGNYHPNQDSSVIMCLIFQAEMRMAQNSASWAA